MKLNDERQVRHHYSMERFSDFPFFVAMATLFTKKGENLNGEAQVKHDVHEPPLPLNLTSFFYTVFICIFLKKKKNQKNCLNSSVQNSWKIFSFLFQNGQQFPNYFIDFNDKSKAS